mmetsp:Transcript_17782/g.37794  ORF Transcript_17782/g.37794 Transcript_17782/m.37794 type:complete len:88 (+) Transcript_17782:304-567(+)
MYHSSRHHSYERMHHMSGERKDSCSKDPAAVRLKIGFRKIRELREIKRQVKGIFVTGFTIVCIFTLRHSLGRVAEAYSSARKHQRVI